MLSSDAERQTVLVAVCVAFLVAFGGFAASLILTQGDGLSDCEPHAEFDRAYAAANDTLVVRHAGGDHIAARDTDALALVVTDAETNQTTTVTWLSGDANRTVRPGDSIVVGDRDDGGTVRAPWVPFDLGPGDEVTVRWTGTSCGEDGEPWTLSRFTVGADG